MTISSAPLLPTKGWLRAEIGVAGVNERVTRLGELRADEFSRALRRLSSLFQSRIPDRQGVDHLRPDLERQADIGGALSISTLESKVHRRWIRALIYVKRAIAQRVQIVLDPMEDRHEQNKTACIDPRFGNGCVGRHNCDSDQPRRARR
jgi:hypothetical protein